MNRSAALNRDEIAIRPLESQADYRACVALQNKIWGAGFGELTSPSILKIAAKIGGIAAGAFDSGGRLAGFVFGLTGILDDRQVHWSHMLAVDPQRRDQGLGRQLKLYQREVVLAAGVEVMVWTYDPLVARNAHLNINRLGVRISEYQADFYDNDPADTAAAGIGMDRFIVVWDLADQILGSRVTPPADFDEIPCVSPAPSGGPEQVILPDAARLRVEIPVDIVAVQARSLEEAGRWRTITRRAFLHYLAQGYKVSGFHSTGDRAFYIVGQKGGD